MSIEDRVCLCGHREDEHNNLDGRCDARGCGCSWYEESDE